MNQIFTLIQTFSFFKMQREQIDKDLAFYVSNGWKIVNVSYIVNPDDQWDINRLVMLMRWEVEA